MQPFVRASQVVEQPIYRGAAVDESARLIDKEVENLIQYKYESQRKVSTVSNVDQFDSPRMHWYSRCKMSCTLPMSASRR